MAKRIKKEVVISDEDLLGASEVTVEVTEEVVAVVKTSKEKKLLGYHPISGEEVWN